MMKKLFWISLRAPYDAVPHAGGKTHNYYLKKLNETGLFSIRLASFCYPEEIKKIDLDQYKIENKIFVLDKGSISLMLRKILSIVGAPVSLVQYAGVRYSIKKICKRYSKLQYKPDIIILQWTEIVMLYKQIRRYFPESKFVCIEEDVTFLKMMRKYQRARGIKRIFIKIQYDILKHKEIEGLSSADLVVLNNDKDCKLVLSEGISEAKTFVSIPYFSDLSENVYKAESQNILFYGAMNRQENEEAVFWIIDNILPELIKKMPGIKLIILGANPSQRILEKSNEYIEITGFVDDITPYFCNALCMVAPLQMGAGIKIKILESLSAGLPTLTNQIGIEGIPAIDMQDYLYCEYAEDYVSAILKLARDKEWATKISNNAKTFIKTSYDREQNISKFSRIVDGI